MKKILLLISIFVLLSNFSFSQVFKEYLTKEGMATALAQAINSGISNPVLYMVATTSEKTESMPQALTPKIDMSNGKATVWMYQFRDAADPAKKVFIAVVKLSLLGTDQFMAQEMPISSINANIPEITKPLGNISWLNSDSLVKVITENSVYNSFKNNYPNTRIQFTILGTNTFNDLFEKDKPFWFSIITGDNAQNTLSCVTNAVTGETSCMEVNSINEDTEGNLVNIYPNPSSSEVTVQIPQAWDDKNIEITLFNTLGSKVYETTLNNQNLFLTIPLGTLPNGNYIVSLRNGKRIVEKMIIINK